MRKGQRRKNEKKKTNYEITCKSSATGRWFSKVILPAEKGSFTFPLEMSRNSSVYSWEKAQSKRANENKQINENQKARMEKIIHNIFHTVAAQYMSNNNKYGELNIWDHYFMVKHLTVHFFFCRKTKAEYSLNL